MTIVKQEKFEPVQRLINFFGSQVKAGSALGVKQGTITGWLNNKHGISPFNAQKAEILTGGTIKASELCPKLLELTGIEKPKKKRRNYYDLQ